MGGNEEPKNVVMMCHVRVLENNSGLRGHEWAGAKHGVGQGGMNEASVKA